MFKQKLRNERRLRGAKELRQSRDLGAVFTGTSDLHKEVSAMTKVSRFIPLKISIRPASAKLTILYEERAVAEVRFGPKISERITEKV